MINTGNTHKEDKKHKEAAIIDVFMNMDYRKKFLLNYYYWYL